MSGGATGCRSNSADEALGLHFDGVDARVCATFRTRPTSAALEPGLAVAPASLSLQSIIHLRQTTGHPVLLAERAANLGVCGETEIIRALAGSRH